MEYRQFPGIDYTPSLLGFGLMRLPLNSDDTADINYELGYEMIKYALDSGINYFDTAYMYHSDQSEIFVGKVLTTFPRSDYLLADKLPVYRVESLDHAKEIFAEQLKKCNVDYFDYYLLHSLDRFTMEKADKFGLYDWLCEYKEQGLIRQLGYSFHDTPDILERYTAKHEWDFVQIQLNYLDWELQNAKRSYQYLLDHGIPVIVMEPIRGGALAKLPESASKKLLQRDKMASEASWALRYVASLPGVMTILSGMSDMAQLKDNIKTITGDYGLSRQDYELLDQVRQLYMESGRVPCTVCHYCMPCPFGVNIPESFAVYNRYVDTDDAKRFCQEYNALGEQQPKACTQCKECEEKCPQKIEISAELKKPRQFFEFTTAPCD
ncbi:MAG TPA: aldo/keto reductase [Clostridiaceae bacterium]|nr:aldo/keto reductase [Clostridiaceae bacterium]